MSLDTVPFSSVSSLFEMVSRTLYTSSRSFRLPHLMLSRWTGRFYRVKYGIDVTYSILIRDNFISVRTWYGFLLRLMLNFSSKYLLKCFLSFTFRKAGCWLHGNIRIQRVNIVNVHTSNSIWWKYKPEEGPTALLGNGWVVDWLVMWPKVEDGPHSTGVWIIGSRARQNGGKCFFLFLNYGHREHRGRSPDGPLSCIPLSFHLPQVKNVVSWTNPTSVSADNSISAGQIRDLFSGASYGEVSLMVII